jgi:hypothetical protein
MIPVSKKLNSSSLATGIWLASGNIRDTNGGLTGVEIGFYDIPIT